MLVVGALGTPQVSGPALWGQEGVMCVQPLLLSVVQTGQLWGLSQQNWEF